MKRIIKNKSLFFSSILTGVFLLAFTSCSSDDDNTAPEPPEDESNTITDIVSSNDDFSMLKDAVVKADLAETLDGDGPFTVFAPDDNAFEASGLDSGTIEDLSSDELENILLYHTLKSKVMADDVPEGPNASVEAANGDSLYVTSNDQGVYVNGVEVTQADIEADNGVIHSINRVLMPPEGNIVEVAQENDDLSYLVAAVLRASEGDTDVASVLTSDGPFTVFAPTNEAFKDAGFESKDDIENADPDDLAAVLTYHVVAARAFSSDLMDGQELTTVNGDDVEIGLGDQATVMGNSNEGPATITATNIMATNGVVHVIDAVLMP